MISQPCQHTAGSVNGRCRVCGAPVPEVTVATGVESIDTTGLPPGASFGPSTRVQGAATEADAAVTIGSAVTGEFGVDRRTTGSLFVGEAFGPRYHVIKMLGVGGMGAVYQAWDAELGVAVALKVIRKDPRIGSVSRDSERRFKTELLLARQVTHKNVVRIHDLGEIDGIKYITMPYIQGDDLGIVLRREGKLPVSRALPLARQIASGLQAAHEAGVVHRDLKPANIMIGVATEGEQALIMDFGISASTSENTAGVVAGTLEYMAPEQATGRPVDARADVYAFGLILYEMLAGPRPSAATGDERVAAMWQRLETGLPPLRTVDETVPEPLANVVMRCLDRDPEQRYATGAELCAALGALDDAGELIPEPRRLTRRQVAAAATAMVAMLAGTYYFARPTPQIQHEPVSVLIADFANRSGDPRLNGTVEQALTTALEGASFVNAYRSDTAHRVAAQLRPGSTTMDEELARLVAIREGVNVVVSGEISQTNRGYRLSARAIDAASAREIARRDIDVASHDALLPAVGRLSAPIRQALGDATKEAEQVAAAITFTSSSLDAAYEYSLGQQFKERDPLRAIEHYRNALKLDPKLGMAYYGMAVASVNLKNRDEAAKYYKAAMSLLDHMSEREKQRMLATYYASFTHDYDQAIEAYQRLVTMYPADAVAYNNLSVAYVYKLDIPNAVAAIRRAIELAPKNVRFHLNHVIYSMYASDFPTAMTEAQRMIREDPNYRYPYVPLAISTLLRGDPNGARQVYLQLEKLHAPTAKIGEADLEMYLGRYKQAVPILENGIQADEREKNGGEAALKYIALSEAYQALGQKTRAAAAAKKAASLSADESVQFPAARALIAAGNETAALEIATKLENTLQTQSRSYAQLLRAEIALQHKRYAEAVDAARAAQKQHDSWIAHFVLGRAYLEAGHAPEALSNFETCIKRQGEGADLMFADSATARYVAPLYFWTARAQSQAGAKAAAADNFRKFLAVRADADTVDPLVAEAERALAQ